MRKWFCIGAACVMALVCLAACHTGGEAPNQEQQEGSGVQTEQKYTLNQVDGGYFVDAVKAMSDASYSGIDLANRLYVHAYSQSVLSANGVNDTALDALAAGENAAFLEMVVCYGGKTMPGEVSGVGEADLLNGDILLADDQVYAYADGLWLLETGATKQDTGAVLGALPEADKYALLRPSYMLGGIVTPTDEAAPKDALNEYQQAVIATAEAYLLRGEKLQYSDTRFTVKGSDVRGEYRWQLKENAPEDCTENHWCYSNCAAFTYDVYYHALGLALPDNMYSTKNLVNNSLGNGTYVYRYHRALDSVQTDEEKAKVEAEFTQQLQPGDILVILRKTGYGHAMLYVGNGNIIHSSGGVYKYSDEGGKEVYEATIRRMKVKDYFFNPASERGYVFGPVQDLAIVRPLQIFNGEIPENTRNRVENMQGIMAQKLCSHTEAQTVNPGEEMTFTYEIYNTNGEEVTLQVVETLPENTTYLSGAETVEGNTLRWTVTVPGDTRVKVSYKLQVNEKTPYGTKIQSTASTVGGVQVKCPAVQVQRSLTAAEQEKLIQAAQELRTQGNTLTGLKLVNQLYQTATGKTVFATTNVTEIAEDIFAKHQMSTEEIPQQLYRFNADSAYGKMVAPTLYGGYRVWSQMWQHQRTSLPRQQDLQVGDVLVGRTPTTWELYLYLGQELGFVNMTTATLEADTVTVPLHLEKLLGYGHYFAILRPAMTM